MNHIIINNKYIFSFISGCITSFAFAPFFIFPLIIIAFIIMMFLIDYTNSKRDSFIIGWLFGFGSFTTGLYWIIYALLTDSDQFIILSPLSNIILPGFLALYPAIAILLTYIINKRINNCLRYFILASNWIITEYLRSILLTGFPWNLIGYSINFSSSLSQIISVIGIYGAGYIVIIIASAIYDLYNKKYNYILIVSSIILSIYLYGNHRLSHETEYIDINLVLVQGNISQHDKWKKDLRFENLSTYMDLSKNKNDETYIIWPESSVPYYPIEDYELLKYLSSILSKNNILITGAISSKDDNGNKLANSVVFINSYGKIIESYDKTHLVPFSEYIPFRSIAPNLIEKISFNFGDFEKGIGPVTLSIGDLPKLSPLICYESIFPSISVNKNDHPYWMLNVTNDGWFGMSTGPYQHFSMSRTRAIEQGIPMVRVANTGISAVIDPYGRILSSIDLGKQGVIESKLPKKLDNRTIYSKFGDTIISIFIIFIYIIYIIKYFKKTESL